MTLVKICGLTEVAGFDTAIEMQADYVGLVFYPASPRYVSFEQAAGLARRYKGGTQLVGLFVAPEIEMVSTVLQTVPLDILQIYGSAALAASVRAHFNCPVWRQLGVSNVAEFPSPVEEIDGFVMEAKPPVGATRPGGNGVQADWGLLSGFRPACPWLLAGGLTPKTVASALARVGAPGVDVSSGVETAPGQKSPALIRQFIQAVRAYS